jgi:hypothetical protein
MPILSAERVVSAGIPPIYTAAKEEIQMKSTRIMIALVATCLLASGSAFAQKSCPFDIVGTWRLTAQDPAIPDYVLRFSSNGVATGFYHDSTGEAAQWREGARSRYKLDNPKTPKSISFSSMDRAGDAAGPDYKITRYDDGAFTQAVTTAVGAQSSSWVRIDPYRYFAVFAAGKGTAAVGAPAFAVLIKTNGRQTQTVAFGLYPERKDSVSVVMGAVPEDIRNEFSKDPGDDSTAMLRVEIARGPYERALQVLKTWEKRARENTLLYPYPYLNNPVYLDELAQSLNQCAETIKMYPLTWRLEDPTNQRHDLPQVPFHNIQELRRLNDSLHISDEKFHEPWQAINLPPQK